VQERLAALGTIGREEGRADPPRSSSGLGLAVAVFLAVFSGMLVLLIRI
jgi:hypothetical protein